MSAAERERFVDILLGIKANLLRLQNGAQAEGPARRRTR
jgi:hypothetical protein